MISSEREVLRKIYGPVLVSWLGRNRHNHDIYDLCKALKLTSNIRLRRLQWVDHTTRMRDERVPQKALKGYLEGRRPVGRSRGRRWDAMDRDAKRMLKCRNWRSRQRIEMPGSGRLKRPRPSLGCSTTEEEKRRRRKCLLKRCLHY